MANHRVNYIITNTQEGQVQPPNITMAANICNAIPEIRSRAFKYVKETKGGADIVCHTHDYLTKVQDALV